MRLYLDTCSLNRLWDDQSQVRIHLEAEAVIYILESIRGGTDEMVASDYLLAEIHDVADPIRRADVLALLEPAALHVPQHSSIDNRALTFATWNIKGYDAFHIAAAEAAQCDYLLTTDDRLIRRSARAGTALCVKVLNPLNYPASFLPP